MTAIFARSTLPRPVADVLAEATGATHRDDPALPGSGGPAGNARLTAWTGFVLLSLSIAELFTLFDVTGLIGWHIVIGALLVPPALLKTASTGWRLGRYYRGHPAYQQAGPPVLLLRLLGPAVVVFTLGCWPPGCCSSCSVRAAAATFWCRSWVSESTGSPSIKHCLWCGQS